MLALPLMLALTLNANARCDRGAPPPTGFHSRGFTYVAEIFPPKSRQNPLARPRAYLYQVDYPGAEWRVKARRLWTAELPNAVMPDAAVVSMEGHVVTLDEYHSVGGDHSLVLVSPSGRLIRSFTLQALLDSADRTKVPFSDCGRMWRDGTKFYFSRGPDARLFVVFRWGSVVEVTLANGALRRGILTDFAALQAIAAQRHPNELTEVWPLNLRFSSLTDRSPPK